MVIKAKKGFYDDFSRKELQNMCKIYGLPANKSHSELEKSLVSFLEKVSHSKSKGNGVYQRKTLQNYSNEKISSFSRDDMDFRPHKREKEGAREICLDSLIESSTKPHRPPFEFHVRSEEGISLLVDLNSGPSDWTEKLRKEVRIFENAHIKNLRSLHADLGCLKESGNEIETLSSPTPNTLVEKLDGSKLEPSEKGELSLALLVPHTSCISVDEPEKSKEDQLPKACGLNSDPQDHITCVADSSAKAGCTNVSTSKLIASNAEKNSICDTVVNSRSRPLNHSTLEHTSAALSVCQNSQLVNDSSLQKPAVDTGCSELSSVWMQSSGVDKDASFLNCEIGGQTAAIDSDPNNSTGYEKSGLTNSSELNLDVFREDLPAAAEEMERSKIVNERESSECSEFTEATCENSDKLSVKEEGVQKKRKHVERGPRNGYFVANTKVLRSMKRITRSKRRLSSVLNSESEHLRENPFFCTLAGAQFGFGRGQDDSSGEYSFPDLEYT